ncbi:hypothetical protein NDU88_002087 [Pleurodeles waltl]|uniref:Secreted protein n=1 Tax=Pleurodeles waltl TaxID=8319 RepID=A0AAV7MM57_PLEWA|nr:hypothetical protein NDU88_002087 [Pleurodeles waltl]
MAQESRPSPLILAVVAAALKSEMFRRALLLFPLHERRPDQLYFRQSVAKTTGFFLHHQAAATMLIRPTPPQADSPLSVHAQTSALGSLFPG